MTTRPRDLALHTAASALLLSGLLGGLVACGDDADPEAGPGPTTGSASPTGPEPTDGTTDGATDAPTRSSVAPADGPRITRPVATVRVPGTWSTKGAPVGDAAREPRGEAALERDVFGFISLEVHEADGSPTLDRAAREAATYATTEGRRVADAELGGEPAFVITESSSFGNTELTTGLVRDGSYVWLTFSLLGSDRRERQQLIDSVLATWEWRQ